MSRSPSVTSHGVDDLSSPDPLATSINDEPSHGSISFACRQSAPKRHSTTTTKNTGRPTKPSSFSRETIPSSPFRTVSEQNLSPWKIRVTVEAEPEDADMESNAPFIKAARTRVTKIPLQPECPPVEQPKISTRGRKSHSNSAKNNKNERPVGDRRNSGRGRRQSVTDLDIIPLGDDSEEDDWLRQKKMPRKRRNSRKSFSATETTTQKASPSKSSRSTPSASRFEVRPDTDVEDSGGPIEQGDSVAKSQSPELRKIDLNQVSVRPRALSAKSNTQNDYDNENSVFSEKISTLEQQRTDFRKVSVNSALSYPTPSPTSSYHGDSDDLEKALDNKIAPKQHENEGFDTILESEGFTMIDLDTLPSAKRSLSSPIDGGSSNGLHTLDMNEPKIEPSTAEPAARAASYLAASNPSTTRQPITYPVIRPDESELSSTVPSSPPASEKNQGLLKIPSSATGGGRKVTPLPYSSPKLPSPPRHNIRRTPQHQHRASAGAVFAGIALQEVVSPDHATERVSAGKQETSSNHPGTNEDGALFMGFDCGTQRELRAGLRFGEELAKRLTSHPIDPPTSSKDKSSESDSVPDAKIPAISEQRSRTQVWRGENLVQHTPVHAGSSTVHSSKVSVVHTPPHPVRKHTEQSIIDTQARREREWQLEREAVSMQIQNASESQVIVIDSDDEDEQPTPRPESPEVAYPDFEVEADDETDIWLAEAKNSSSPNQAIQVKTNSLFTPTEQIKQRQRVQEVVSRARRSLIPSPWRKGENVHAPPEQGTFLSTDVEEASSLMFYNEPESKIPFGAGEIKRQQLRHRRNSGKFDIDLMAGTPKKVVGDRMADSSDMVVSKEEDREEDNPVALSLSSPEAECERLNANDNVAVVDSSANEISASSGSSYSSPQPVKIPVNFNDSSISISTPPPQSDLSQAQRLDGDEAREDSPVRPPTPRSAMKGSRHSVIQELGFARPDAGNMIRKVVFSQRSRGVDVDGQESSFSMRSSSDDSFEDSVGLQLNRELQATETEARQNDNSEPVFSERDIETQHTVSARTEARDDLSVANPSKGWGNWIWGSKQPSDHDSQTEEQFSADRPGVPLKPTMSSRGPVKNKDQSQNSGWEKTKASIPSSSETSSKVKVQVQTVPSYLIPPSYPSDPLRSIKRPLSLGGDFSNTHFRTLHIIYRKSLRPKFHPPPREMIRPEIRALRGTEMVVDESANGIVKGEFAWTVGDGECEVLERFMQECEYSHGWYKGRKVRVDTAQEIKWGWSVVQLAEWLCRIVVGEVVREEEKKAAKGQ